MVSLRDDDCYPPHPNPLPPRLRLRSDGRRGEMVGSLSREERGKSARFVSAFERGNGRALFRGRKGEKVLASFQLSRGEMVGLSFSKRRGKIVGLSFMHDASNRPLKKKTVKINPLCYKGNNKHLALRERVTYYTCSLTQLFICKSSCKQVTISRSSYFIARQADSAPDRVVL